MFSDEGFAAWITDWALMTLFGWRIIFFLWTPMDIYCMILGFSDELILEPYLPWFIPAVFRAIF